MSQRYTSQGLANEISHENPNPYPLKDVVSRGDLPIPYPEPISSHMGYSMGYPISFRPLRCDKLQRDARFLSFDFDALRKKVFELYSSDSFITNYEKKNGGYNRVFISYAKTQGVLWRGFPLPSRGQPG